MWVMLLLFAAANGPVVLSDGRLPRLARVDHMS